MATVILGSGIIGLSTAYYLSRSTTPSSIHLVEPSPKLFASASGNAAGFLARDWFPSASASLGELSFELHKELAVEHQGQSKWGYNHSIGSTVSLAQRSDSDKPKNGYDWLTQGSSRAEAAVPIEIRDSSDNPSWLVLKSGEQIEKISSRDDTAQVDPLRLCHFLLDECKSKGIQLHHPARAVSVTADLQGDLATVRILSTDNGVETDLPAARLVIAAGVWSDEVFKDLFPDSNVKLSVDRLAGHSLVVKDPEWKAVDDKRGCHAVFMADDRGFSPEIFSRNGGEVYVAGLNSSKIPIPQLATEAKVEPSSIQRLKNLAKEIVRSNQQADDLEVVRSALCFRPVTKSGVPIISRIDDEYLGGVKTRLGKEGGVFLATGHGPWGISMSLGTGLVTADLIEGREPTASIQDLRFRPERISSKAR